MTYARKGLDSVFLHNKFAPFEPVIWDLMHCGTRSTWPLGTLSPKALVTKDTAKKRDG